MTGVSVGDIERAIAAEFPLERAEAWDRCGLLAGDADAAVSGVVLALDPTRSAVDDAVARGANVLVTHHPAFLTAPERLAPGAGSAGVVFAAVSRGVALINAHTNLDRDARAQGLIPAALGLDPLEPLERSLQPMSLVTVFAPPSVGETIVDAMAAAERVTAAAVSAHPYEEPLVLVEHGAIARNAARLGMLCATPAPTTLGELARVAASEYGCTPRVWGSAEADVNRVATATGSAGSLVGQVISSGADVLVAGEVRYHDALEAVASGVGVIELGHDVTEWPLVALLENAVRSLSGLPDTAVHVLPADRGWWTPAEREGEL